MKTKSTSLNLMRATFAMFAIACIIGTISFAADEMLNELQAGVREVFRVKAARKARSFIRHCQR